MPNLAIIPARGGSKRIPGKNIRSFAGKPIIAYSINAALISGLFDTVMVSTDDEAIAAIAREYGAQVPFMRSAQNSGDFAGTAAVISEVLDCYADQDIHFQHACCLYPTAPFVTAAKIEEAFSLLTGQAYTSVFPVCAFGYPVQRGLRRSETGLTEMLWPENQEKRSQDLEKVYHDAGLFYWINVVKFRDYGKLFTDNSGTIIMNELDVQDIDTETDWKLAELKFQLLNPERV